MFRNFLILGLLILLTQCGRNEPSIEGVDLPPTLTNFSGPKRAVKVKLSLTPNSSNVVIENGVTFLNAPLVLLRGEIDQYPTEMTAEPGP